MVGTNLSVGSGASQLTFSLLVVGLSLVPSFAACVSVVRNAHGSARAGKSHPFAFCYGDRFLCLLASVWSWPRGSGTEES